jgi:hypothetical protein
MRTFWRQNSAITTVEFALVAPIALIILCVALESARLQVASLLLQRSIYDLAYRAKTDQDRNQNFPMLAQEVLERRSNGMFGVEEITVQARAHDRVDSVRAAGYEGCGSPQEIVRLTFTAELSLFPSLVPEPLKIKRTFDYYYINEIG